MCGNFSLARAHPGRREEGGIALGAAVRAQAQATIGVWSNTDTRFRSVQRGRIPPHTWSPLTRARLLIFAWKGSPQCEADDMRRVVVTESRMIAQLFDRDLHHLPVVRIARWTNGIIRFASQRVSDATDITYAVRCVWSRATLQEIVAIYRKCRAGHQCDCRGYYRGSAYLHASQDFEVFQGTSQQSSA